MSANWRYIVCLALLFWALAGCRVAERLSDAPPGSAEALVASGTLTARQVRVASELGGRVVALPHQRGDHVSKGETLAVLDDTLVRAELAQARAALAAAEANLDLLQAGPLPAEIEAAEAQLALATAEREAAYVAWQDALAAIEAPDELDGMLTEARTNVQLAELGVQAAEVALEQEIYDRDLRGEGDPNYAYHDNQVQVAQAALETAQCDLQTARTYLNQLYAISADPIALQAQARLAQGEYEAAAAQVEVAREKLADLRQHVSAGEVAEAQALVEQARAYVNLLALKREMLTLKSPLEGLVVERLVQVGEAVTQGAPLLTVASLERLDLSVYVPVTRLDEVSVGQRVSIQVDSFPQRAFMGQVTRIADQAEFTPRNVATQEERVNTVYAVQIQVDNRAGELKPGMPADATFEGNDE